MYTFLASWAILCNAWQELKNLARSVWQTALGTLDAASGSLGILGTTWKFVCFFFDEKSANPLTVLLLLQFNLFIYGTQLTSAILIAYWFCLFFRQCGRINLLRSIVAIVLACAWRTSWSHRNWSAEIADDPNTKVCLLCYFFSTMLLADWN